MALKSQMRLLGNRIKIDKPVLVDFWATWWTL